MPACRSSNTPDKVNFRSPHRKPVALAGEARRTVPVRNEIMAAVRRGGAGEVETVRLAFRHPVIHDARRTAPAKRRAGEALPRWGRYPALAPMRH